MELPVSVSRRRLFRRTDRLDRPALADIPDHEVAHDLCRFPLVRVVLDGSEEGAPQVRLEPERVARVALGWHGVSSCRDTLDRTLGLRCRATLGIVGVMTPDPRLPDRFWAKTCVEDVGYKTPCLTWTGFKTTAGYGRFGWQGKSDFAHRVAYKVLVGPILAGLELDHLCRNRACVNVDHLEPVTHRENVLRGTAPAAARARQTHCKRGHEFTPENTRINKAGHRNCIACMLVRSNGQSGWSAWNEKRRAVRAEARKNRPPKQRKPRWADRTHCAKGHLLAEAGIYVDKTGKPYCRECIRVRSRRAYWRKQEAAGLADNPKPEEPRCGQPVVVRGRPEESDICGRPASHRGRHKGAASLAKAFRRQQVRRGIRMPDADPTIPSLPSTGTEG